MSTLLMIHDYPPLTGGGLAIGAVELAVLLQDDFRFRVVSSRVADHFADDRLARSADVENEPGCPEWALLRSRRALAWARGADAVIVHWTFSFRALSTGALLLAPFLRRPTVCVIHTTPRHCGYNRIRRLPVGARRPLFAALAAALRRCSAVVALGPSQAAALRAARVCEPSVLPLPVIPRAGYRRAFEQRRRPGEPLTTVGIVGELSRLKGSDELDSLLRALAPRFRVRIAGQGPLRDDVGATIAALAPEQRAAVELLDPINPRHMPELYASVDCVLVLSRTESQCRVALEAMLAGAIVLARPSEGIVDVIEHRCTGLLVDPGDPPALLAALAALAAAPGEAAAIRQRAHERALRSFEDSRAEWRRFLSKTVAAGT
jgi:glycosyltransferase involved in cell wall biosynthesis